MLHFSERNTPFCKSALCNTPDQVLVRRSKLLQEEQSVNRELNEKSENGYMWGPLTKNKTKKQQLKLTTQEMSKHGVRRPNCTVLTVRIITSIPWVIMERPGLDRMCVCLPLAEERRTGINMWQADFGLKVVASYWPPKISEASLIPPGVSSVAAGVAQVEVYCRHSSHFCLNPFSAALCAKLLPPAPWIMHIHTCKSWSCLEEWNLGKRLCPWSQHSYREGGLFIIWHHTMFWYKSTAE